ncbi:MAG: hypothetical protein KJ771_08855 [Nanoarchaeota archaeon]|nr:hypothetical protein [Nanoarchaeota archaeon]
MSRDNLIRRTLFGRETLSDIVILTPITDIYNNLFQSHELVRQTKGWWYSKDFRAENRLISFVKTPQSYPIVDAVRALDSPEKVFFVGYAGGNSNKVEVGEVMCPQEAVSDTYIARMTNQACINYNINHGRILLVHNLLGQDDSLIERMKKEHIHAVDMETYIVYSECNRRGIDVASFLVITDLIDTKPFYMIGPEEYTLVRRSYEGIKNMICGAIND